ncbi:FAD/NAD(P)-binding domain-containing protein [Polyplosphaeria fusca]|uniref:FAD/NAD(P)-binding domain-containing protein n=1 Tax=Polyplosphaeria fusca TaxID=682080 RepID=A0A9P4V9I7_9PLEO|nr:FAD/NAD(P)-binding domain-containing protein [Polyplosphaeria fusca]
MSTTTRTKLRVLISGAGIAGPCLAFWLARTRHDISITIVERSPDRRATGQSIDIRGPAIDIIKKMKLEEQIRALDTTETGTELIDASGKAFAKFGKGEAFTANYEVLRAELAGLFLDATEKLDNVSYRYGDSVTSLEQTEKEVHVTFASGATETFDMIAGADGSSSPTRPMILDAKTLEGSYNFLGQYIAFFTIPKGPTDTKIWKWFNTTKGRCLMLRPHRNNETMGAYMCITMPKHGVHDPAVEAALKGGASAQKRLLREYFANGGWEAQRILDGMDQSDDFYMSRAAHVKLPKWTNGRGVLLGDAAFATFGVGTSLAIDAGYVLAGELSKISDPSEVPQALERYEEVFRGLYKVMGGGIPGYPQFAFPQTATGIWILSSLMWAISKTKVYKLLPKDTEGVGWEPPQYDWVDV